MNPPPIPVLPSWLWGHKFACRPFSGNLGALPTCSWPSKLLRMLSDLYKLLVLSCHSATLLSPSIIRKALCNFFWRWWLLLHIVSFPRCLPAVWSKSWCYSFHSAFAIQVKCWFITLLLFLSGWNCALYEINFLFLCLRTSCWIISLLTSRSRPVITVDISIFLPASINITAPQCHDGLQPVNCLNVTACFRFSGKRLPGTIGKGPVPALGRGTAAGWPGVKGFIWGQLLCEVTDFKVSWAKQFHKVEDSLGSLLGYVFAFQWGCWYNTSTSLVKGEKCVLGHDMICLTDDKNIFQVS